MSELKLPVGLDLGSLSNDELKDLCTQVKAEVNNRGMETSSDDCSVGNRQGDFTLKDLVPVVEALGKTLGKQYEVVLHNVLQTESSVMAIANEHVTGRSVGSPATDLLVEIINSESVNNNMVLNYANRTKDGRKLKSSTVLIRSNKGDAIGCLCINIDLTNMEVAKKFIESISFVNEEHGEESLENFPEDVTEFQKIMIEKSMRLVDKPISLCTKEDKLRVVRYLHQNNMFNIKGSVEEVAKALNVSRYTIYNYVEEVNFQ